MQNILTVIKATSLFAGLEDNEIKELYTSLRMYPQKFKAGTYIQHIEDTYQCLGLVLSGKVHMISEDIWGNRNLIAEFGQGQFYGESHSLTGTPMFFDIVAAEESELLFINILKCIVWPGKPVLRRKSCWVIYSRACCTKNFHICGNRISFHAGRSGKSCQRIYPTKPAAVLLWFLRFPITDSSWPTIWL
ncbi:MAG: cyclic nucleotide-binding domain-containing protein [Acidaminococcaceae bacterium]|nr:cyclic nucleotide-binding domain-containing protein [Acidaminococcaceae bacterium]